MAITATYSSVTFRLDVTGSAPAESITIRRDPAGVLQVNAGAVPITGGVATVANTSLISALGMEGNDVVTLDEANGALPPAEFHGGTGNDTLTGGSGGDTLLGEGDNDTLLGKGGNDLLFGGPGNDILTGGDADDQMFGEDGDDRMIWNPGDDSDLMEGGLGNDIAEVNGGNGAEVFTVTANGTRVRFDRVDPAPFALDIGTTESLVLNAGGGDDTISTSGNIAALIALTLDGGTGNDTILGGNGADTILGGDGNDFVDGNQGNDVAFLGNGDDLFQWDPGDGSDIVEGQANIDTLLFNGSAANEIFTLSANGVRTQFTRNVGSIVMDVNDVEGFSINALGGTDTITLNDLTGTDVTGVAINLSGTIGGVTGDSATDLLIVSGSAVANLIAVTGAGTGFSISGLPGSVTVTNSEGANDSLRIDGLGGDDSITATALPAGIVALVLDGGSGNDTIMASQGADVIFGGDGADFVLGDNGNDTAFLGTGNDVFQWDPGDGNDIIEGQADQDELRFNGSNASENIVLSANGGRIVLSRDVASVLMDVNDVEKFTIRTLGGLDNITLNDLSGTDVTHVELHLEASGGGGDGAADTVTATSTNAADVIALSSPGGIVTVTGLPATLSLFGTEGASDRLNLNAGGGDDVINASTFGVGLVTLAVNGGLGNDMFVGSAGGETFTGGDGNDTALLGGGNDVAVWNPGDDNDIIEGQAGTDTLRFNGANIAETINIAPNGGRVLFTRDVAAVAMDLNDTEVIAFAALGGTDTINVGDLSGTDVTQVAIDLASTIGGAAGDAQVDTVTLSASGGANTIDLSGATGALLTVTGLPGTVTLSQFETSGSPDRLTILGLGGNDSISALGLAPKLGTLTIDGGLGNDIVRSNGDGAYYGGDGDDMIFAGLTSSLETLDGGTGIDTLDTTSWGGTYVINMVTGITNYAGESFLNFENLVTGAGADTITGTAGANTIVTQDGIDSVSAGAGNDVVAGGDGGDTLDGGADFDILDYRLSNAAVTIDLAANSASGGHATGDVISNFEGVYGSASGDTLTGNSLANILDGGAGADILTGGLGDDTYYADNVGDVINELAGQGNDTLYVGYSFSVGTLSVETVRAIDPLATTAINLTGNATFNWFVGNAGNNTLSGAGGDDRLEGGGGNDVLNGGAGNDLMIGGAGSDQYIVTEVGDTTQELPGGGNDLVTLILAAGGSYALGAEIEMMTITGNNTQGHGNALANILSSTGTGNGLFGEGGNDTLNGSANADLLDGGTGADLMKGGAGDDNYVVDDAGDVVTEFAAGGTDTVTSSVNWALGAETENLILTGAALNGTGNALANAITGNGGNNVLDGGAGADTMTGGLGNDTYYADNVGDVIVEVAGQGSDTLYVGFSFTVSAALSVETVRAIDPLATTAINLTGNATFNWLVGNAGNNTLSGAGGDDRLEGGAGNDVLNGGANNDLMIGGTGNDQYIVTEVGDTTQELAGGGNDLVTLILAAGGSYTLAAEVEMMTITGNNSQGHGNAAANILSSTGTGNSLFGEGGNDTLNGSINADTMHGGAGMDTLKGGAGNDILFGEADADTFLFLTGSGADQIADFVHASDRVDLTAYAIASFAALQSMMSQVGADTLINLGSGNSITLTGIAMGTLTAGDFLLAGGSALQVPLPGEPEEEAGFELETIDASYPAIAPGSIAAIAGMSPAYDPPAAEVYFL